MTTYIRAPLRVLVGSDQRPSVDLERSDSLLIPCCPVSNFYRATPKCLSSLEIPHTESHRAAAKQRVFPVFSRLSGNCRSREERQVRSRLHPPHPSLGGTAVSGSARYTLRKFARLARNPAGQCGTETRLFRFYTRVSASVSVARIPSPHFG